MDYRRPAIASHGQMRAHLVLLMASETYHPPTRARLQDHTGMTGVLNDVATRLQKPESLFPGIVAQRKADKETKGWYDLSPMAQQVILATRAFDRTPLPPFPPPTYTDSSTLGMRLLYKRTLPWPI